MAEERSVVIAGPATGGAHLALDGLFRAGASFDAGGVVIAPPHPLYGGSMASPVVTELAFAAAHAGLASLRFDWRGVGGSAGAASGEAADHDADYTSALGHLAETVPGPLCAAGYSAGAAAAVRAGARSPRVRSLLLVAPPPAMLDQAALEAFRGRVLVVVGAEDGLAPPEVLENRMRSLASARVEVLPEVDHFFAAGLPALGRAAAQFLGAGEPTAG
jgi:alpha/beta superfamily hydrolase